MPQSNGPLTGLRVVEFVGIGPGPHVAMLLADLGAEVVRIERPGGRMANPVVDRARHRVEVDLKSEEGRQFIHDATAHADVLVEGYRPGVMERLGLGPDAMLAHNPRLVYARMTGWGQDGPLAQAAGHDINYIAITGALAAVGRPGEPAQPPQNLVGDFGGGSMYCAFGILAALYERERSGKGQVVDAAIVDGATSLMSFFFGVRHQPHLSTDRGKGMLSGGAHFYRCYECADGREISVGAIEPQFYAELLERIDAPAELREGQMNPANWADYTARLAALFKTKPAAEWASLLEGTDACAAEVLALEEAREHPHMKARNAYVERDGVWHTAPAPRFDRTPGTIRESAQDGAEVVERWKAGG
ncbi:CaiB/BaiF CoA-transferase family protein [Altererythrobacter arenosus]|uniref:CaiB/BaiF CoA-transferase family protein n=1 Tax=Altererythrobacter arenosus TaxID=3032592 RepID=A0ABY8FQ02_9SPHN|nr:CaiB/BaiF CoA-transferase family protein [Altererythrobacter sp. CAU 1644]WFL75978.1 CaiB/BaiF CoA-transferase family protein [Altererythrobacter sp. CAU 1644]